MKCPHCNGTGTEEKTTNIIVNKKVIGTTRICNKCFGKGKLDWIEVILSKKKFDHDALFNHRSTVITDAITW